MAYLLAIPLLGALLLVQTAILSRAPLLQGTPDLLFLVIIAWAVRPRVRSYWFWSLVAALLIGYTSALSYPVPLISYGLATMLAVVLRRRVWRVLLLAYLLVIFTGTLLFQGLTVVTLFAEGAALPIGDIVNQVVLPGLVLNLFLALPVYVLVGDLADRLYPEELDIE
jgi:cell shape-determining protein MreD